MADPSAEESAPMDGCTQAAPQRRARLAAEIAFFVRGLVWAAALLASISTLAQALPLWLQDEDTTIPEGSIIYSVQRLLTDGGLYRDYRHPPYATTAYTPLLYLVTGGLVRLVGDPGDLGMLYRVGRAVVLATGIGCALVLWRIGCLAYSKRDAAIAALTVGWCGFLLPWAATTRPDLPALFFGLSALWGIARPGGTRAVRVVAAACLVAAAMATKQSAVAVPVAIVVYLLSRREVGTAVAFAALAAVALAVSFAVFQAIWPHFWQNVAGANVAPMMALRAAVLTGWAVLKSWPLVLVGGLGWWVSLRSSSPVVRLMQIHGVLAWLAAAATSAKAGAALNYFLEPAFSLAFFVPAAVAWVSERHWGVRLVGAVGAGAILLSVLYVGFNRWLSPQPSVPVARVLARAAQMGRPVLFQDAGLALRYGEPILLLDTFNASYLSDAGVIDLTPLARRLHEHEVAAVVLRQYGPYAYVWEVNWLPRLVAQEIVAHYELVDLIAPESWFYAPRSDDTETSCYFHRRLAR